MSTSPPPVELQDRDYSGSTPLWNVQEHSSERTSDPRVDAIYSQNSDETFLVGLEEQERIMINGRATAFRISNHTDYANDPMEALGEYAATLLAHVNGHQGVGWTLSNTFTGRSLPGVIEQIQIIKRRTEKYEFDYSITFRIGQGMMPPEALDPEPSGPSGTAMIAGVSLGEIEEMMITKQQSLTPHTYVTATSSEDNPDAGLTFEDVELQAKSGALREIMLKGRIAGSESERQTFDDAIRSKSGQNTTITFESHFPGNDLEVMVSSFESTRESGQTRLGDYNIEVIEGTVGAGGG